MWSNYNAYYSDLILLKNNNYAKISESILAVISNKIT